MRVLVAHKRRHYHDFVSFCRLLSSQPLARPHLPIALPIVLVAATLFAGCGSPGTRVRIIDAVDASGRLSLKDVDLVTLRDIETVRGDIAEFIGGATLRIGQGFPLDRGASRDDVTKNPGSVAAHWIMDGDVVVPSDFDSLVMLSAYAHVEKAALFFSSVGVTEAADQVPVYYAPNLAEAEALDLPETDNAAYFPDADGFILLPMKILQEIPFGTNPGVVAHEYSHRVWYYGIWGGEMFAALAEHQQDGWDLQEAAAWNRLRATDEGIADFLATAVTGDAEFLAESVPPSLSDPRNLSVVRIMDAAWLAGSQPLDGHGQFDVYTPGAVVASTLWSIAQEAGVQVVARAVVEAQRALAPSLRISLRYQYGELEAEVIARLPAASTLSACARAQQSYAATWVRFQAVCP